MIAWDHTASCAAGHPESSVVVQEGWPQMHCGNGRAEQATWRIQKKSNYNSNSINWQVIHADKYFLMMYFVMIVKSILCPPSFILSFSENISKCGFCPFFNFLTLCESAWRATTGCQAFCVEKHNCFNWIHFMWVTHWRDYTFGAISVTESVTQHLQKSICALKLNPLPAQVIHSFCEFIWVTGSKWLICSFTAQFKAAGIETQRANTVTDLVDFSKCSYNSSCTTVTCSTIESRELRR